MSKNISMADIAKELGISKTTVSRAFKNSSEISEEQKNNVLAKAKELNYRFNSSAKTLRTNKTNNIGIIANDLFLHSGESFYNRIFHSLIIILKTYEYNCLLEIKQNDQLPLFIREMKVDGIIILGQIDEDYLNLIDKEGFPIVLIDTKHEQFNSIYTDSFHSAFNMTNYLLAKNHTKIAFIGNSNASTSIMERFFGYQMALEQAKIRLNPEYIINDRDLNNNEIELVLPTKIPSAFFCNNDKTAFELINLLQEKGLKVPDDVSVVGFDDTIYSTLSRPKITTAHVPIDLFAKEGARLLISNINHKDLPISNLSLTAKLIIRDSITKKKS